MVFRAPRAKVYLSKDASVRSLLVVVWMAMASVAKWWNTTGTNRAAGNGGHGACS